MKMCSQHLASAGVKFSGIIQTCSSQLFKLISGHWTLPIPGSTAIDMENRPIYIELRGRLPNGLLVTLCVRFGQAYVTSGHLFDRDKGHCLLKALASDAPPSVHPSHRRLKFLGYPSATRRSLSLNL